MKQCTVCKQIKSLTSFHIRKASPDGLRPSCKECVRVYCEKSRVLRRATKQAWVCKNKDHVKAMTKRIEFATAKDSERGSENMMQNEKWRTSILDWLTI